MSPGQGPEREAHWTFPLEAEFGWRDITPEVSELVARSRVRTGGVILSLKGSTGAITTIEHEAGALADLRRALDQLAPVDIEYAHNAAYQDGNGFSHVRSALLKTGIAIPVTEGRLQVGRWQQIIVINLDNRPRQREVVAVVVGD
jgi:secondary thiamine-phosphate synthase enzyme